MGKQAVELLDAFEALPSDDKQAYESLAFFNLHNWKP
jgi:hypothetical protein